MNLTKHQTRKLAKLQHEIDYFCGQPCFEVSPVINTMPIPDSDTVLIHISNAPKSRWYETRIDFWAYISPRGKIEQLRSDLHDKSIYDKHFKAC